MSDLRIIDIHTHIGQLPGAVGDVFTSEDLIYICEHENVHFMLASSASATTINQHIATKEIVNMVRDYGNKLGGMLWVNPHDPTWMEDVPFAKEYHFYGIKIHPVLDHYAVTEDALDSVFSCAQVHKWPILTHTDVDGTPMAAECYEPLIKKYRDVVLILAHLRWGAIPLAKRYDNVFLDTTYMNAVTVEIGIDALSADKILFGSDAAEGFDVGRIPGRERPRRSYQGLIESYLERGISHKALEKVCFVNAQQIFNIQED